MRHVTHKPGSRFAPLAGLDPTAIMFSYPRLTSSAVPLGGGSRLAPAITGQP